MEGTTVQKVAFDRLVAVFGLRSSDHTKKTSTE